LGLSRDLIIRGLADKLQQRAQGGPTRALQRRLRILAGEFEKGARSFDPGGVLKTGATLGAAVARTHPYRPRKWSISGSAALMAPEESKPKAIETATARQEERGRVYRIAEPASL
jgi:hypothetical protein